MQKKIQRSTNIQTKENVLNRSKKLKNIKNLNKYRNKSKRNESYCCYQEKAKILQQIGKKNNSTIRAGIGPNQDEEGNLEPSNKKMSEQLNGQYNSVFSTPDPTMTIQYPKNFFGHPQANTLSDINITREDIINGIKTIS